MTERQYDVVIVGGGPAGVSAALECSDIQLDTLLLEGGPALGGQLPEISHPIRNVATGQYAGGEALQTGLQQAAQHLGDHVLVNHPVQATGLAEGWVEAAGRRFRGKSLLIASGSTPEHLAAAVNGAFGGDVTYDLGDQIDRFAGRPVVIIGGGDSATLDALALASTASSVLLAHRSPGLTARHDIVAQIRAEPRITDLPGWELESVRGGQRLEEVVLVDPATGDRRVVAAGGLDVKISRDPNTGPFRGQIELDRRGFVVTDTELRASRPGVFAAGDVVSGSYWRVSAALGQGSLAARSVLRYLQGDPGEPAASRQPATLQGP